MKNLVILVIVLVAAAIGGRYLWTNFQTKNRIDEARIRVEGMLSAVQGNDEQSAVGYWALGAPVLSEEELRRAVDGWNDFAIANGLAAVRSFSCETPVLVGEAGAEITCKVDDRSLRFRAVPRQRISIER